MGLERHDAIVRYIAKTARLDAQLLAEDILTSGSHPRKVFYVLV